MKKTEWYPLLPPDLLQSAYKSTNELAWSEDQALCVIAILESKGLVVTAVEPWLATKLGPGPLGFDWYYTYHQTRKIFPPTAEEFIRRFDELYPAEVHLKSGEIIVFNIAAQPKDKINSRLQSSL